MNPLTGRGVHLFDRHHFRVKRDGKQCRFNESKSPVVEELKRSQLAPGHVNGQPESRRVKQIGIAAAAKGSGKPRLVTWRSQGIKQVDAHNALQRQATGVEHNAGRRRTFETSKDDHYQRPK